MRNNIIIALILCCGMMLVGDWVGAKSESMTLEGRGSYYGNDLDYMVYPPNLGEPVTLEDIIDERIDKRLNEIADILVRDSKELDEVSALFGGIIAGAAQMDATTLRVVANAIRASEEPSDE